MRVVPSRAGRRASMAQALPALLAQSDRPVGPAESAYS